MSRSIITYIVFFICSLNCYAQMFSTPVYGKILDRNYKPIDSIEVLLLENSTILDSTFTDSIGRFQFKTQFYNNEYSIVAKCYDRNDFQEIIKTKDDTSKVESYHYELICTGIPEKGNNENIIYFSFNSVKEPENLNVEYYRSLLEEYPNLCLEFRQISNPKEGFETAKTRLNFFKSQLEKVGCDMTRITISFDIEYLNDKQLNIDERSRIIESVISNEGNCK